MTDRPPDALTPFADPAPPPLLPGDTAATGAPPPGPDAAATDTLRPILVRERLAALVEVVLCSGFPTQLLIVVVLRWLGLRAQGPDGAMAPSFVFTLSLLDAVLVVGLVCYFIRDGNERISDVFLGRRRVLPEALLGVALVPVVFFLLVAVLAALLALVPSLHNVAVNPLGAMMQTPRDVAIFAVVVTLAGGVREEIQRAFVLHRFDDYLGGGAVGVVVYSLAFGLGHLQQGYDAVVATAVLGAFWGVTYLLRRSIVATVTSHAGFNLVQLLKYTLLR